MSVCKADLSAKRICWTSDFEQDDHITKAIAEHHSAKKGTSTRLLSEVGAGGVGARGTRNNTISEESGLSTIMSGTLSAATLDISLQPDDIPRSRGRSFAAPFRLWTCAVNTRQGEAGRAAVGARAALA